MSTAATIGDIVKLFRPHALRNEPCLKLQLLFVIFRDLLHKSGIKRDRGRRLCVLQAILNAFYVSEHTMRNSSSQAIAEFKLHSSLFSISGTITGKSIVGGMNNNRFLLASDEQRG